VADVPFDLPPPLAERLRAALDVEGKIPRALVALGDLAGHDVALLDVPDALHAARLRDLGVEVRRLDLADPFRIDLPPGSLDAVIALWSAFRGIDPTAVAEVDRVLRPGGKLLLVHDYGRDDVSALRPADAPEAAWGRRDGPFLRNGFKIRVLHCFWTFGSLDEAREFLGEAFDGRGAELGAGLRRPRLTWKVAIYHRVRGGAAPAEAGPATLAG